MSNTQFTIHSHIKDYSVKTVNSIEFIEKLLLLDNTEFIIDHKVYELYLQCFKTVNTERLFLVEATEDNKVIDTALGICEKMTDIPAKRNARVVSIGGGIIQDITGFVASILYRGINWTFVPTTLLAACDSCIGGKTSLNYRKFKNLLGTFYPPDEIIICSDFFKTLSQKDYYSGLGEVVKFSIMSGMNGLTSVEHDLELLLNRSPRIVDAYVKSSLRYKKCFIEQDEFDKGERIKLNFAHTFGHAIEVISDYIIPHGTAVAIGMIMANNISYERGYITEDIKKRSEALLLNIIKIDLNILKKPLGLYLSAIRKDKKQVSNTLTAVLITKFGATSELTVVHDVTEDEIAGAIQYFIELYGFRK